MTAVHIAAVDERSSGSEDDQPRFRVFLQDTGQAPDVRTSAWTATYDITDADLLQRRAGRGRRPAAD